MSKKWFKINFRQNKRKKKVILIPNHKTMSLNQHQATSKQKRKNLNKLNKSHQYVLKFLNSSWNFNLNILEHIVSHKNKKS